MTAVIGFNLGCCGLMVADTRISSLEGHDPRDEDQKILRVPFGLLAGAGTRGMVRAIAEKVRQDGMTPLDIPQLMRAYNDRARADHSDLDGSALYFLQNTHMIAMTVEQAPSGGAVLSMFEYFPAEGGRFLGDEVETGAVRLIGPTPRRELEALLGRCRREMVMPRPTPLERMTQPDHLVDALTANIRLAADVIAEIASFDNSVSPAFMIGVQYSTADVRISGPHDRAPDPAWLR